MADSRPQADSQPLPNAAHHRAAFEPLAVDPAAARTALRAARLLAIVVLICATATVLGWALRIPVLLSILPGAATLKLNAAICFVAGAIATIIRLSPVHPGRAAVLRVCAGLIALLAGSALVAEWAGWKNPLDELLLTDWSASPAASAPGRMSPASALCLLLISTALLLPDRPAAQRITQMLLLLAAFTAYMIALGYIYNAPALHRFTFDRSVALTTSLGLLALSGSLLLSRPDVGVLAPLLVRSEVSRLLRRGLPFVIIVPILIASVLLAAERLGYVDGSMFLALVVLLTTLGLGVLLMLLARPLLQSESERRRAQRALEESELRYRRLAEGCGIGIWELTTDHRTRYVNRAMADLLEVDSPADAIGGAIDEFYEPNDLARLKSELAKRRTGDSSVYELTIRGRRGTFRNVLVSGSPIVDAQGRVTAMVGYLLDITDRKAAERQLRESRAFLQQALEIGRIASFAADLEPTVKLVWSAETCSLFGASPDDFDGRADTWLALVWPQDRAIVRAAWEQAVERRTRFQIDFRIGTDARNPRWIHVTARPVEFNRHHVRLLGVAQDITERKSFEVNLLQAQKMETIGRLAGGIAHDLNNLLTAIFGHIELARACGPSPAIALHLDHIQESGERGARLTQQLLGFSRKQVIQPATVDLNAIVTRTGELLRPIIGENIALNVCKGESLWPIFADPMQVEQVLMNLAVNARDAMPNGGTLTIETANVNFEGPTPGHPDVPAGEYVLLSVADTGTGMTETVRQRAFEPFFSTKPTGKGTGLGLATCFGIAKQAGGSIWLYSEPGQGTVVKVLLPRSTAALSAAASAAEASASGELRGNESILLVEDEPLIRNMSAVALRRLGYEVTVAADGPAALEAAESLARLDLLITDVVMPGMNGKVLADRLVGGRPGLRVLFVSGYTENTIVHQGIVDDGVNFLPKPFTLQMLTQRVRQVLDARQPSSP